jgi:DNA-binding SARP family transcriptional activator
VDGVEVEPELWAYGKPKELLVYLLINAKGSSRDRMARALWPNAAPSQLKNSFHVTLHHLRKALGHSEWIVVEEDRYRLARDVAYEFDADVFDKAAEQARQHPHSRVEERVKQLSAIVALYRGDLLEGEVGGQWIEEHVSRYRRLYLNVALQLGSALESSGQADAAIDVYRGIIARDQLQEEPHRRLLACWARSGDRMRAVKHYERLATTLRETLDAEPERETVQLYQRILADAAV